jgi:hypothetical protein
MADILPERALIGMSSDDQQHVSLSHTTTVADG